MSKKRVYPISDAFKNTLKTPDALTIALKLLRTLKKRFKLSESEVDILIFIGSYEDPVSLSILKSHIDYITVPHLKTVLTKMARDNFLTETVDIENDELIYSVPLKMSFLMKNLTQI